MIQTPNAISLKICQQAIIQAGTNYVTLVNCFRILRLRTFPALSEPFTVCAVLSDGIGNATMSVVVHQLSTDGEIFKKNWSTTFPDPLAERWFFVNVKRCLFPAQGSYEISLLADSILIAHTKLFVARKES